MIRKKLLSTLFLPHPPRLVRERLDDPLSMVESHVDHLDAEEVLAIALRGMAETKRRRALWDNAQRNLDAVAKLIEQATSLWASIRSGSQIGTSRIIGTRSTRAITSEPMTSPLGLTSLSARCWRRPKPQQYNRNKTIFYRCTVAQRRNPD